MSSCCLGRESPGVRTFSAGRVALVCRGDVSLAGRHCNLEGLICKRFTADGDLTTVAKVYRGLLTCSSWRWKRLSYAACPDDRHAICTRLVRRDPSICHVDVMPDLGTHRRTHRTTTTTTNTNTATTTTIITTTTTTTTTTTPAAVTPHADTKAADIMNNNSKDTYCAAGKQLIAAEFDDVVRGCCWVPHTLWCLLRAEACRKCRVAV